MACRRLVAGESETAQLRAQRRDVVQRFVDRERFDRRFRSVQFVQLMLREIAGDKLARAHQFAAFVRAAFRQRVSPMSIYRYR